jgi:hypothetical protein
LYGCIAIVFGICEILSVSVLLLEYETLRICLDNSHMFEGPSLHYEYRAVLMYQYLSHFKTPLLDIFGYTEFVKVFLCDCYHLFPAVILGFWEHCIILPPYKLMMLKSNNSKNTKEGSCHC